MDVRKRLLSEPTSGRITVVTTDIEGFSGVKEGFSSVNACQVQSAGARMNNMPCRFIPMVRPGQAQRQCCFSVPPPPSHPASDQLAAQACLTTEAQAQSQMLICYACGKCNTHMPPPLLFPFAQLSLHRPDEA